jgi:prepilin-type N-terminal cleavage/methylation domain-containing protein
MVFHSKEEKGFTLIEVLVVIAILGIIALIVTLNVSSAIKRQRLEAGASQLQSFIEGAAIYARERSSGVFVWLHQGNAPGGGGDQWWYCYLIQDNGDDILNYQINDPNAVPPGNGPDGDTYIISEKVGLEGGIALPFDIVIHPTTGQPNVAPVSDDAGGWPGFNNWPVFNNNDFYLLCDPRGLPFNPNVPVQIVQPTTISITHREMAAGELSQKIRYDITISPLWHTKVDQVLYSLTP